MTHLEKLTAFFIKFPGIGPRQARRFVYFLFKQPEVFRIELARNLTEIGTYVATCSKCFRFFEKKEAIKIPICGICSDQSRDRDILMIVEKDSDLENIEKSDTYNGLYFVLGGAIPILEKEPSKKVRLQELITKIKKMAVEDKLREVVFALSATTEGDYTSEKIKECLQPLLKDKKIILSSLGRGLSSGLELEYSDAETLKSALENRRR